MVVYYVYILYSEKFDRFYVGQTMNLQNRVDRHNKGLENATSPYIPWVILWHTTKNNRSEAVILEQKLKNLSRNRKHTFIEKYS